MFLSDLPTALFWYFTLLVMGVAFLPITYKLFQKFPDYGWAFSKIVGLALLSYSVWILGSLHILPFSWLGTIGLLIIWLMVGIGILTLSFNHKHKLRINSEPLVSMYKTYFNKRLGLILFEEILFLLMFLFWMWVRGHEPSVHGLEKFMDFGFVNSILNSTYFPPKDMWLTYANDPRYTGGFFINYYYFGHLTLAVLTKLTAIASSITYNLMLSTLFAFCFTASFSVGFSLLSSFTTVNLKESSRPHLFSRFINSLRSFFSRSMNGKTVVSNVTTNSSNTINRLSRFAFIGGLLSACLVTLAGNLHTIYLFTSGYPNESPVPFWNILKFTISGTTYWYPNATRFIPNTIHEFPAYSWVVADLHGHVFDIPYVLLTLALIFSLSLYLFKNLRKPSLIITGVIGLMTAIMYMTNAWDGIIYFGLTALLIAVWCVMRFGQVGKNLKAKTVLLDAGFLFLTLVLGFIIFSFLFNFHFKPFVSGIGVVGGWELLNALKLIRADTKVVTIGPFLFEQGNNLRSPVWMMGVLWGFFVFNIVGFFLYFYKRYIVKVSSKSFLPEFAKNAVPLRTSHIYLLLLIIVSLGLLVFPEFFYAKDIYPAHYRANTMFKLGYQAFIMLSLLSGFIIIQLSSLRKRIYSSFPPLTGSLWSYGLTFFLVIESFLLVLVLIYPYYAIKAYYGVFRDRKYTTSDGLQWLATSYPADYAVVNFLNGEKLKNPKKSMVILEAVGDSYTDHARISANTGIPTIVGWPVHEWLWRGSYDEAGARREEVRKIYEGTDLVQIKQLLEKFGVTHIVIGGMEKTAYPAMNELLLESLGNTVFSSGNTKVIEIN